jgi:hypothetical protein
VRGEGSEGVGCVKYLYDKSLIFIYFDYLPTFQIRNTDIQR